MDNEQIHDTLTEINERFDAGEHERSLELCTMLKQAMLDAEPHCDPMLLGWVRFYEFKSLYELGKHQEAFDLLNRPESRSFVVGTRNAAFMYSVGSELAMHLGLPDEVVRLGGLCLDLRIKGDDPLSAVQCASTVCELLRRMERDELNTRFARYLLEVGREHGAERPLILGLRCLARSAEQSGDEAIRREVDETLPELEALRHGEFADEVESALEAIASGTD